METPLVGLATPSAAAPVQPEKEELVSRNSPPPPFDAKLAASRPVSGAECVKTAQLVLAESRDNGWAMLKACVERGKFPRGDFTDLRPLFSGNWDSEFARRPDAPQLAAKLVALRGGDVTDVKSFQKSKVMLFTLAAAIKQPDTYKGRMLLVRATLDETKGSGKAVTAKLTEIGFSAEKREFENEGRRVHREEHVRGRSEYGGKFEGHSDITYRQTTVRYENNFVPTGNKALGKLPQNDPFLEPGKDYLFLVRFDGVVKPPGESDDDDDDKKASVANVSIVAYYVPNPMIMD